MTVDFLSEIIETTRRWHIFFKNQDSSSEIRILCSVKFSFRNEEKINILSKERKLKESVVTR